MSIGPGCFAYSAPEVNKSLNQTAKVRRYMIYLFALLHNLHATTIVLVVWLSY